MKRIFDHEEVAEICNSIKRILQETQEYMEEMRPLSEEADRAAGRVPSYVRSSGIKLHSAALRLKMNQAQGLIEELTEKLDGSRERGSVLIPEADRSYAEQTRTLEGELRRLKESWALLKEFLADTPLDTDYAAFEADLSVMLTSCEKVSGDARRAVEALLASIKGARNISAVYSRDPVNLESGNFIYDRTDLETGGREPFAFIRFYNAVNRRRGVLGADWNHNYEIFLEKDAEGVSVILEQGKEERFSETPTGNYVPLYGSGGELEKSVEGYTYTLKSGRKYFFDGEGKCQKEELESGMEIRFSYEGAPGKKRLAKAEKESGEYFAFSYDREGCLCSVEDHTGRKISYEVKDGRLVSAGTACGGKIRYGYGAGGKLEKVINARGICAVENTYDGQMRCTRQRFPDGSSMSYAYDDGNRTVELTERNGARTTYVHDERYRDIKHIDSEGEERYEYNKRNQRTLSVDRLGNRTQYGYDEKGNLTRIINALGIKTEITYEEHGRASAVYVDGKEKVRNRYGKGGELEEMKDALGNTWRFSYAGKGRPGEVTWPDGSSLHIVYDRRGNITELTDRSGSVSRYAYDALNRVTESTDGNGNRTRYAYDSAGNITKVINAEGKERRYAYNESGKVTEIRDFDGESIRREYNELGLPSRITDKEGNQTELSYDAMWNLARVTEPDGSKTTYIYNEQNRLSRVKKADGSQVRFCYDAAGRRTGISDEYGNLTGFAYDALGRLIKVTEPCGEETRYAYDAEGNLTEAADALGNRVQMSYDAMGNLVKETNALGESRSYAYSPFGKIEKVTDEAGRETRYLYAPGGRLEEVCHPDGTKESYSYDGNGNVVSYRDRGGFVLAYAYDSLDRVVEITGSSGEKKSYAYDGAGNVAEVTDTLGNRTRYSYTPSGRLKKVWDALGHETEYAYDVCGRLIEIRQYGETEDAGAPGPDGMLSGVQERNRESRSCRISRYAYGLSGQVSKITDALGGEEAYTYGKKGELLTKLDKDGYLTSYSYTPGGEVESIRYGDGRQVRLSYNALHQLEEVEDWLGTTRIENDALGRTVKVSHPDGREVSYSYGKAGERRAVTYPDGRKVLYEYDSLLRLTALKAGEDVVSYAYDGLGRLSEKHFPNGAGTRYTYDGRGFLSGLVHSDREGVLDSYRYGYDQAGNKTSIEKQRRGLPEESGSYRYSYDGLGRLVKAKKDGELLRSYAYDAFGNRTGMVHGGKETAYTYDALDRLTGMTGSLGEESYRYDKRGNLREVYTAEGIKKRYVYGSINRLEEAADAGGGKACYAYNGLGQRVGKSLWEKSSGAAAGREVQIRYTLDLTRQYHNLLEQEETGTGRGKQTFLWDGNAAMMSAGEAGGYYLQDELGSPVRFMDRDGNVSESYGYDEFGQDLYGNQGEAQPFGYTGYRYDRTAGTYFAQAREYMAWAGRFAGRDVIKGHTGFPETLNEYGYCRGNPMAFVDLNGMSPAPAEVQGMPSYMLVGNYSQEAVDWASAGIGQAMEKIEEIEREINEWADENVGVITRAEEKGYFGFATGVFYNKITYAGESKLIDVTAKNGLFESALLNSEESIGGATIRSSFGMTRDGITINANCSWVSKGGIKNNVNARWSALGGGFEWGQGQENKISGGGYRISLNPFKSLDIYSYDSGTGPLSSRNETGVFINSGLLEAVAVAVAVAAVAVCGSASAPAALENVCEFSVKKQAAKVVTLQQTREVPLAASILGFLGIDSIIDASCNRGES